MDRLARLGPHVCPVLMMSFPDARGHGRMPAIHRGAGRLPAELRGAVASIGNFDGVHLGHRRLIEDAQREAAARGAPGAVLTFDPHPRAFFRPADPHFRLTGEREKMKILSALGVDLVVLRPFDATLAATSTRDFVDDLLARDLGTSGIVVGSDFRFGRDREGDPSRLERLAAEAGMSCSVVAPVQLEGAPVSSSRVRDRLAEGDVAAANALLGHRWFVSGPVLHGDKRGRTLGFPTANMALDPGCRLRHGIYAVRIAVGPGDVRGGVASFGRRPTFDDGPPKLESFLFGFDGDLYGRELEVEFVGWIRGEERFESAEALVDRMNRDADEARSLLARQEGVAVSFVG